MARGSAPGARLGIPGPVEVLWLRLEAKEVGPDLLVLHLVSSSRREGPGVPPAELARLLRPGDLVRVEVATAPVDDRCSTAGTIMGGQGTPAAGEDVAASIASPPPAEVAS